MIKVQQETRKGKLVSTETPEDGNMGYFKLISLGGAVF